MCRQEVEDEALYSMHIPASVYRVRGPQRGRLLHGTWWLSPAQDVAFGMSCPPPPCTPLGQAGDLPKGWQLRDVPACRVAVSPVLVLPCTSPGSAPHPFAPRSAWASLLFPLQIRKGPSASSVPFPPSSPLLSCPPDGARHMVMYQGGGATLGVGRLPTLYGDGAGQGLTLLLSPPEQAGPARQRH